MPPVRGSGRAIVLPASQILAGRARMDKEPPHRLACGQVDINRGRAGRPGIEEVPLERRLRPGHLSPGHLSALSTASMSTTHRFRCL